MKPVSKTTIALALATSLFSFSSTALAKPFDGASIWDSILVAFSGTNRPDPEGSGTNRPDPSATSGTNRPDPSARSGTNRPDPKKG